MTTYTNPINESCKLLIGKHTSDERWDMIMNERIPIAYFTHNLTCATYNSLLTAIGPIIPGVERKYVLLRDLWNLDMGKILNSKGKPNEKISKEVYNFLQGLANANWEDVYEWLNPQPEPEPSAILDTAHKFMLFLNSETGDKLKKELNGLPMIAKYTVAYQIWRGAR